MENGAQLDTTQMAADLVAAFVSNNSLPASDLGALLVQVHTALVGLSAPAAAPIEQFERATPAQIRKSISPDALISFLDGKPYKTLKRHLGIHGLTPPTYRERYGLPVDYPTVAASYSAARSALAKDLGLGNQRRKAPAPAAELAPAAKPKRAPRSRKSTEPA